MSLLQLDEFKTRQRATWEGADYSACTPYIAEVGELVVTRGAITPGCACSRSHAAPGMPPFPQPALALA